MAGNGTIDAANNTVTISAPASAATRSFTPLGAAKTNTRGPQPDWWALAGPSALALPAGQISGPNGQTGMIVLDQRVDVRNDFSVTIGLDSGASATFEGMVIGLTNAGGAKSTINTYGPIGLGLADSASDNILISKTNSIIFPMIAYFNETRLIISDEDGKVTRTFVGAGTYVPSTGVADAGPSGTPELFTLSWVAPTGGATDGALTLSVNGSIVIYNNYAVNLQKVAGGNFMHIAVGASLAQSTLTTGDYQARPITPTSWTGTYEFNVMRPSAVNVEAGTTTAITLTGISTAFTSGTNLSAAQTGLAAAASVDTVTPNAGAQTLAANVVAPALSAPAVPGTITLTETVTGSPAGVVVLGVQPVLFRPVAATYGPSSTNTAAARHWDRTEEWQLAVSTGNTSSVGAVTSSKKLDLTQNATLVFDLNFSTDLLAGNGISLLIHDQPGGAGYLGSTFGYMNGASMPTRSLALAFDVSGTTGNGGFRVGAVNAAGTALSAPFTSGTTTTGFTGLDTAGGLQNGAWYRLTVNWAAGAQTIGATLSNLALNNASGGQTRDIIAAGTALDLRTLVGATGTPSNSAWVAIAGQSVPVSGFPAQPPKMLVRPRYSLLAGTWV
jgi:hypothetical protein